MKGLASKYGLAIDCVVSLVWMTQNSKDVFEFSRRKCLFYVI